MGNTAHQMAPFCTWFPVLLLAYGLRKCIFPLAIAELVLHLKKTKKKAGVSIGNKISGRAEKKNNKPSRWYQHLFMSTVLLIDLLLNLF